MISEDAGSKLAGLLFPDTSSPPGTFTRRGASYCGFARCQSNAMFTKNRSCHFKGCGVRHSYNTRACSQVVIAADRCRLKRLLEAIVRTGSKPIAFLCSLGWGDLETSITVTCLAGETLRASGGFHSRNDITSNSNPRKWDSPGSFFGSW